MNLFFRDFRPTEPIATGGQWLAALGARMAYALGLALYGRLTAPQTWALGVLIAAWFATSVNPVTAPLAIVVNAILVGFGAGRLLTRLGSIVGKLGNGFRLAYAANTESELEKAGAAILAGLDEYALNALSAFVNEATFTAIQVQVLKVFPIPDWFSGVLEKGLYGVEFDAQSPLASGARWFTALAARVCIAFIDSLKYTSLRRELEVSAGQLWVLGLLLGGWVALSLIPATAALADTLNAILIGIGLVSLAGQAAEIGAALTAGLRLAYTARSDAELDNASRALAPAVTDTVVVSLELLFSLAAFKAAEAIVLKRFPIPDAVNRRLGRRKAQVPKRAEPAASEGGKPTEPGRPGGTENEGKPREGGGRRSESDKPSDEQSRRREGGKAREVAKTLAKTEALRRVPQGPDLAVYALAAAAVVGVGFSVAVLARAKK